MEDKIGEIVHQEDYLVSPTTQVFALIGVIWLSLKIFSFWRMIASLFILPGIKLSKLSKKGTWALITGASDGIGKEYALQLSAKGYNTILVSRTKTKLDALSSQIEAAYHTQTRVLAMDFAANNDKDFAKLGKIVDELEVGILVNNVGLSHSIPVPFVETEEKEMRDIITINCTGTLRVTALVAPGMAKRRKGLILTMASFGGILPTPLLATYSGSKAFLQQWSSALHSELQPYGVHVQLVQSYLVTSAMSKIRRPTWMIPTPRTFVRAALTRLGQGGGSQDILGTSTPYWAHAVYQWALVNFVGTMNGFVIGINKRMHEGIRKRALRKAEREKKGS